MRYIYVLLLFFSFLLVGCDESERQQTESLASPSLVNSGLGESATTSNNQTLGTQVATGGATTGFAGTIATAQGDLGLGLYGSTKENNSIITSAGYAVISINIGTMIPVLVTVPEPTPGGITLAAISLMMLLMLRRQRFHKSPESSHEKD